MATTAGKKTTFQISIDGGTTWVTPAGIDDIGGFAPKKAKLEKTYFGTSGAVDKFVGLADLTFAPKGDWIQGDTGQGDIISAYTNETAMTVKILLDGAHGYSVAGIVIGYNIGSTVAGKVTFSFDFEATALPAAI